MKTLPKKDTVSPSDKTDLTGCRKIIPDGDLECVWASGGVVPYKLCDANFDCGNCVFDLAMRGAYKMTTQRMFVRGCKFCPSYFYHRGHAWAMVEENAHIRIGLDDLGQKLLGSIEKIILPGSGKKMSDESILLKGRGIEVRLTPPVEGYVVEINDSILSQPSLINISPYSRGWLALIRPTHLSKNLKQLLYGTAALRWFEEETIKLYCVFVDETDHIRSEVGVTFQDGGLLNFDLLDRLHPAKRKAIIKQFFTYQPPRRPRKNDDFNV
jgi:glycine cleavage system H protein